MTDSRQHSPYNSRLANLPRLAIGLTAVTYILLGFLETLPGDFVPAVLYFLALGVVALGLMPFVLGLPNGRKSLGDYARDIRLLPLKPLGRNVLLGLMMAALTLSSILLAALLTGEFVLDWRLVPALRWVKGLTRGVWEEVYFRGIILVLFMRLYPRRKAVFLASFLFAAAHLNPMRLSLGTLVDVLSIFFMGLLFTYVVLKTGSLLPAIVFHYVHDIFLLVVQHTPGADETLASALLFALLWTALAVGAVITRYVVERWPAGASDLAATQA